MKAYQPEGCLINTAENKRLIASSAGLHEAMAGGKILEGRVSVCDGEHNMIIDFPCMKGIIPRIEGAIGIDDGTTRDIALISKVNKPVCFKIIAINCDKNGNETAVLSRRIVQEQCKSEYIDNLTPGDIIPARVTHLEQFGCFVDVGCGIPSLIPIDAISVSRISHPSDRFKVGQDIKVIIKSLDNGRIWLSHKELLGTWIENAAMFKTGETVSGIVRSVEDYGIFIELAPNLAGLAEPRENVRVGQAASVYIKALIPEKMKVKLIIVDVFENSVFPSKINYFITSGRLTKWVYSTNECYKNICSEFV